VVGSLVVPLNTNYQACAIAAGKAMVTKPKGAMEHDIIQY
jgi:hypothetical protein